MRIQILSDLHLEYMRDEGKAFINQYSKYDADLLIVAGDLTSGYRLDKVLGWLCDIYPNVVYVAGNHDHYNHSFSYLTEVREQLSNKYKNLHWLENSITNINGYRILGCTLWFPEDSDYKRYRDHLSDFSKIEHFEKLVFDKNQESVNWLRANLQLNDIVVTHHLPSHKCVHPKWADSPLNRFFLCDLTDLIKEKKPLLWVYGHTHESKDFFIGDTRLVCNPMGYTRNMALGPETENKDFKFRKLIEIKCT